MTSRSGQFRVSGHDEAPTTAASDAFVADIADAFLSCEQSLAGAASVVKLTYNLSRRLSMIGRAGTDNSVDLLYSISFC